jgi:hypothetical protein
MKFNLGCLIVSPTGRDILQDFVSNKKFHINIDSKYQIIELNFEYKIPFCSYSNGEFKFSIS